MHDARKKIFWRGGILLKVALVGCTGYIAGFLVRKLMAMKEVENIVKIGRTEENVLDLYQPMLFNYDILSNVDSVIFTAAVSSPDICEKDYDNCWKVNVEGTKFFIEQALKRKCKVIFLSSDAVYGNNPGMVFSEKSETKPNTAYGRMKKTIEDTFSDNKNFKALRLAYVVSMKDKFVNYCLKCREKDMIAEIFHPFYRNCILISDVEDIVCNLLCDWTHYPFTFLNVAGEELVSRVRIIDEMNIYLNTKIQYKIIEPSQDFFLNRPMITQMKSIYISKYGIMCQNMFTQKIKKMVEENYNE